MADKVKNSKPRAKTNEQETESKEKPAAKDAKPAVAADKTVAKAGRRSAKAVAEEEEKKAKEERKKQTAKPDTKNQTSKAKQKPPRTRLERAGKKYREAAKLIDKDRIYDLPEALELAIRTSSVKFDASVEMHVNLNVDPKQADQNVRGTVNLPSGSGKNIRVAVFAEGDDLKKARDAGADIAGSDDLLASIDKNELNFDVLITTASLMPRLGKYAKVLGPKGLMPNPKSGTITADIAAAVKAAKAGKVEYRVDQAGIIHLGIGKVGFGQVKLLANAHAVTSSVKAARPPSVKGTYIKSSYITTTMGPSIKVSF